ncbi:hypothetical protein FACS1894111_00220 [Clostridia bacterium]|nr:hypothetical protein FACS1894111_00220 [Clostridia bacterium]
MQKTAVEIQLHQILAFTKYAHTIKNWEQYKILHDTSEERWEQFWDSLQDPAYAEACFTGNRTTKLQIEAIPAKEQSISAYAEIILTAAKDYGFSTHVFAVSFLVKKLGDFRLFLHLLKTIESEAGADWSLKYCLYGQIQTMMVTQPSFQGNDAKLICGKIYKDLIHTVKADFAATGFATGKWRGPLDKGFVIVTVYQFLSLGHGPTKTALDRCITLIKRMGKSVLLLNTTEFMGGAEADYAPVYHAMFPPYEKDYSEESQYVYEGVSIPFFQCPPYMPDLLVIKELLTYLKKLQPAYLIHIGGSSIFTEIASDFLPTLTISTAPSELAMTLGQFQVIGRKLLQSDLELLQARGKDKSHVIEGRFTSSLKPQEKHFTREDFGFLQSDFLCAVVGGRLYGEVREEFISMLLSIEDKRVKFVWIGDMGGAYEKYCESWDGFRERSYSLGLVEDVLAVLECCDVYVNPIRLGGGTSVIEAMHHGLPVISTAYGDVGLGAGSDFQVSDYEEMAKEIRRLESDPDYYQKKSALAKKRAEEMLDTDTAFTEIIEEAEKRMFGIKMCIQ